MSGYDGCAHPGWRRDFASNGRLHEFCISCGAERRINHDAPTDEAARLRNGLRWIRHMAAMHCLGNSVDPPQMRALAVLAEKVLDGEELADYDRRMNAARDKAVAWAREAGLELLTEQDLTDREHALGGQDPPNRRDPSTDPELTGERDLMSNPNFLASAEVPVVPAQSPGS
jgi:hypothetical protein